MQNQAYRLHWAVLHVALRIVGVATLCFAALSFIAFHSTPRAYAAGPSLMAVSGSAASSPSSGPTGTTIAVIGSGWGMPDGTPVAFGYQVYSSCSNVADSQSGSLSSGQFSGWFRWPSGTALNTFHVCAVLGDSVIAVAGSFTVLSSNPPSVSIAPSTLSANNQASVTASDYYPAGTQVNFLWMSGNTVIDNLNSAISNTSGIAILTFTVPNFSIASGSYTINASASDGQQVTLSSSTSFTFHAPIVPPSPTPNPSPTPSPAATQSVTTTAQASATPTTGATPTVSTSPTVASNQTPATNGTTPGNNDGSNIGTPGTSSSNSLLIGAAVAVLLGLLLAGVLVALLVSRRRKAASAQAMAIPPGIPNSAGQVPWPNPRGIFMNTGAMAPPLNNSGTGNPNAASYSPYGPVSRPDAFMPRADNIPAMANMPVAAGAGTVGAGIAAGNGNGMSPNGSLTRPPSQPLQPPAWLTSPPSGSFAPGAVGNQAMTASADPALDAMRQQAQAGLFVAPRPYKDERSQ